MDGGNHDLDMTEIRSTLLRIEHLLSLLARQAVRETLEKELETETARAVYAKTGTKTAREIAQEVNVGIATVSRMWNRWEELGLLVKEKGRFSRVFSAGGDAAETKELSSPGSKKRLTRTETLKPDAEELFVQTGDAADGVSIG